jgi:carbamoyl-phosphate synthase small subunit
LKFEKNTNIGNANMKALIVLEDGTVFHGRSFTGPIETTGEVVFNTSMTGYQEILTDPSYCGQMVTMTYPLIGNYGINQEDVESSRIQVSALIVKEYQEVFSNWRSTAGLLEYLTESGIPGIEGIDTRALTRHIRVRGAMKAIISTQDMDAGSLTQKANSSQDMVGLDLVKKVTCKKPILWSNNRPVELKEGLEKFRWPKSDKRRVVAMDFGVKYNILRSLEQKGCEVLLVPATTSSDAIDELKPDGLFLSNGPGDPAAVTYAVDTIKDQIGKRPVFGICLGHQLIGLALGGKTFKLKFGHRGANQPVKDLSTGKVEITSQNHGFCVDMNSLTDPNVELSHINLNDNTVEGLNHKKLPLFSVQYHPEASPGPHDAGYLFERFTQMIDKYK